MPPTIGYNRMEEQEQSQQRQQQQRTIQQPQQQQQHTIQQVNTMLLPNQPITVVSQPQPQMAADQFQSSALRQLKLLSLAQISMGWLCIIFGIVLAALDDGLHTYIVYTNQNYLGRIGYGIWNGIFFVLVGGIGIGAVRYNNRIWIIGNMALNIFCAVIWCEALAALSSIGLILTSGDDCRLSDTCWRIANLNVRIPPYDTFFALNSLMLIMSVVQFVITIWCAVLCCGAVCKCCKKSTAMVPATHVAQGTTGERQQVTYPSTFPTSPVAQTGFNMPQGYTVGAHQPVMSRSQDTPGYMVQSQGAPGYTVQPQGAPGYIMQAQAASGYTAQLQGTPGYVAQPQGAPGYVVQPQGVPGYAVQSQGAPGYMAQVQVTPGDLIQPQGSPGYVVQLQGTTGDMVQPQAAPSNSTQSENPPAHTNQSTTNQEQTQKESYLADCRAQCLKDTNS